MNNTFSPQLNETKDTQPAIKRSRKGWIIGGVVITLCLCVGLCGIVFSGSNLSRTEKPKVAKVIDTFMKAMVEKDAQQAYTLFSERGKENVTLEFLEQMPQGKNYVIFEGYQETEIPDLSTSSPIFVVGSSLPKGTTATARGFVYYQGDITGKVEAILEEENGEWKLVYINITVPPSKIDTSP